MVIHKGRGWWRGEIIYDIVKENGNVAGHERVMVGFDEREDAGDGGGWVGVGDGDGEWDGVIVQ